MNEPADMDARCQDYVRLLERGHAISEVATKYGLARNAVHQALLVRGLPTSMKDAVRAYWKRQDAAAQAGRAAAATTAAAGA